MATKEIATTMVRALSSYVLWIKKEMKKYFIEEFSHYSFYQYAKVNGELPTLFAYNDIIFFFFSVLEKEEDTVTSYLQSGFNRVG